MTRGVLVPAAEPVVSVLGAVRAGVEAAGWLPVPDQVGLAASWRWLDPVGDREIRVDALPGGQGWLVDGRAGQQRVLLRTGDGSDQVVATLRAWRVLPEDGA